MADVFFAMKIVNQFSYTTFKPPRILKALTKFCSAKTLRKANRCCFAGKEDELLVSSRGEFVFIWQLPVAGGKGERTIDLTLLAFTVTFTSVLSVLTITMVSSLYAI